MEGRTREGEREKLNLGDWKGGDKERLTLQERERERERGERERGEEERT